MAPTLQIDLAIEARPVVRLVGCLNDGEERRLLDWLTHRDELSELIERALELARQEPAA